MASLARSIGQSKGVDKKLAYAGPFPRLPMEANPRDRGLERGCHMADAQYLQTHIEMAQILSLFLIFRCK